MGFGLRGALTNLLALSEFIMSLLTYQKVFVLWPNIGCSLTENFVNFSTPRPDGRRADAVTFPLPPPAPSATSVLLPSDIMSGGASEEDLDDVDIPEDEYLFEIVERAPASSSLLNVMREMPIYRGFVEFATDPGKPRPGMLTKVEAKRLLSQEHVDWESLHTRLLEQIFLFRATSISTTGTETTGLIDARFKLHGKLAREFPPSSRTPARRRGRGGRLPSTLSPSTSQDSWTTASSRGEVSSLPKLILSSRGIGSQRGGA